MKNSAYIYKKILNDMIRFLPTVLICVVSMLAIQGLFGKICLWRIVAGIPCPACGMTRAFLLLAGGHPVQSVRMHPAAVLTIIGVALYIFEKYFYNYRKHNDIKFEQLKFTRMYVILCLIFIVVLYIIRMRLYFPNIAPLQYDRENFLYKILRRN